MNRGGFAWQSFSVQQASALAEPAKSDTVVAICRVAAHLTGGTGNFETLSLAREAFVLAFVLDHGSLTVLGEFAVAHVAHCEVTMLQAHVAVRAVFAVAVVSVPRLAGKWVIPYRAVVQRRRFCAGGGAVDAFVHSREGKETDERRQPKRPPRCLFIAEAT